MRGLDKTALVEEELQELKMRYELLEGDRKAFYETSQHAMRRNKEEIGQLRTQNKEISESLAMLKKHDNELNSGKYRSLAPSDKMDLRVCELVKKCDDLQAQKNDKEDKLQELMSEMRLLQKEETILNAHKKESEEAHEIQVLENRLDKAVIKFNEAQSIRKTYEEIIMRLQEERVQFDNQIATFERLLKTKRHELQELETIARDANHAKDVAKTELSRFEQRVGEDRKQREREIQHLKELIKQKRQMDESNEKNQIAFQEDKFLNADNKKDQVDESAERRMLEFEETMRVIKEATGVSNIDEVLQKFTSQKETNTHLLELQKQNEERFQNLKEKKTEMLARVEEAKVAGEAKRSHTRQMIAEFEQHLKDAQANEDESKSKYERMAGVLVSLKAGICHLADKLDGIQLAQGQPAKMSMSDETAVAILDTCAQKLTTLNDTIRAKELADGELPILPTIITQAVLPQHNARVKLQSVQQDIDEAVSEEDDDVLDRETLKRYTAQMLNARIKAKQPKRSKKKPNKAVKEKDEEEEDSS